MGEELQSGDVVMVYSTNVCLMPPKHISTSNQNGAGNVRCILSQLCCYEDKKKTTETHTGMVGLAPTWESCIPHQKVWDPAAPPLLIGYLPMHVLGGNV